MLSGGEALAKRARRLSPFWQNQAIRAQGSAAGPAALSRVVLGPATCSTGTDGGSGSASELTLDLTSHGPHTDGRTPSLGEAQWPRVRPSCSPVRVGVHVPSPGPFSSSAGAQRVTRTKPSDRHRCFSWSKRKSSGICLCFMIT